MGNGVRWVVPEGWVSPACSPVLNACEEVLPPVAELLLQVSALEPGPEAIALLHGLAGRRMTSQQSLRVAGLWQPQLAWVTGAEQAAVLRFAGPTPDPTDKKAVLDDGFVPNLLAPVLASTRDHAADRVVTARQLCEQFFDLGELLRCGELDAYRVRVISEVLNTLVTVEQVERVQAQILPVAAGLSVRQLRRRLRKLAREVDPDWNTAMFAKARQGRRVTFSPEGQDGLVGMHAFLPPVEAIAVQHHLEKAAQTGPVTPEDERDHDERMCDALIGAVLGSTPGDPTTPMSPDVTVNVFIPAPLLLGLTRELEETGQGDATGQAGDAEPAGELAGYGALPVGVIRSLAGDASWRRWVLEPVTGHLLDLGKHRYTPSPELAEYVRARDRYCRYPGCNRTAARGDLDHLDPYNHQRPPDDEQAPGGPTSASNLAAECRRHHRGKTLGRFQVTGDPNGTLTWTDQHGNTGQTRPHDYNEGL
jgi:hypothetical protein